VYRIHEAFADLIRVPGDVDALGRTIRSKAYRYTAFPSV
jgi:hypothetical protein